MKSRPILMSAPMVRAILNGTKTQTRRQVCNQFAADAEPAEVAATSPEGWLISGHSGLWRDDAGACLDDAIRCPYGIPGELLRVKESVWMWCERRPNGTTPTGRHKWWYVPMCEAGVFYAADHPKKPKIDVVSPETGNHWGWRLKIGRFMPAWASRITLENIGVRVERLNDISAEDCIAEGLSTTLREHDAVCALHDAYKDLWESINGAGSWAANPWVWCVEFRRI